MNKYYLAIDIGASSGRHLLGWMENGKISLKEVYRFPNGLVSRNNAVCWDMNALYNHIIQGMKLCREIGMIPFCMAIDTWGVDFVLLDGKDAMIGEAVGYRDPRTRGMDVKLAKIMDEYELYTRTGIQKQLFNTIYQLLAIKEKNPKQLRKAKSLLMIPDYLNFMLTGIKESEYTEATTSQLVYMDTCQWDIKLIKRIGLPRGIFMPLKPAGSEIGMLRQSVAEEIGYNLKVIHAASHDTGSAILALPTNKEDIIYLSSGTWSLMGIETKNPDVSLQSMKHNFTNEGGYDKRYRYLKNIMGLWMVQSIKKELADAYTFPELSAMARDQKDTPWRIDVNDAAFLAPQSMLHAVKTVCNAEMTLPEIVCTVYHSLADKYAETVREIEDVTGRSYSAIHIIGGGCRDDYLNELTARKCKKPVFTGPTEATALGNIIAQMLGTGEFKTLKQAREAIANSFDIREVHA